MKNYKISAIICAAGKGKRAGFEQNKLLAPLDGAPVLWHTLKKFNIAEIDEVIVTAAKCDLKAIGALCKPFGYTVVTGGKTRTDSVKKALKAVTGDIVLIHDGARPFVKKQTILSCIETVKKYGSAVCAVKSTDTLVSGTLGQICDTLDRDSTYRVQTPQGFMTEDIIHAYKLAGDKTFTDDSAAYCEYISQARIVDGDEENIKLTYKKDFDRVLPLAFSGGRIGLGVDVHAFCEGDGIALGGVKIPFNKSFAAHSDGDAAIHALMDALLSAAGLDDIGHLFPVDDDAYAGADSRELLKTVVQKIRSAGYAVQNISLTIQAENPKLAPYIDEMKDVLCAITGADRNAVAISAGTCEKLGFVGEGLGIAAYCAVTLCEPSSHKGQN